MTSTSDRVIQAVSIAVLVFAAMFTAFALTNPAPWSPMGQVRDQRPAPVQLPVVPDTPAPASLDA